MILVILTINTLVLIGWLRYLHHLDDFTADKRNEYTLFWFVIIGGIFSIILALIMNSL